MSESEGKRYPRLDDFGRWVSSKVRVLASGGRTEAGIVIEGYLKNGAYATSSVARLRHAVGHHIGDDPGIFEWTFEGMPQTVDGRACLGSGDEPTDFERAAYVAITLFALHQQSIHDLSMHTDEDMTMGRALGRLVIGNPNEAGIRMRFDQLQTADDWRELTRHAQGLVRLLKREKIPLNYGQFADDLVRLRRGRETANGVRLRWGRDFIGASRPRVENADTKDQPAVDTKRRPTDGIAG